MKKINSIALVFLFIMFNGIAQEEKKAQDINAIKAMCGCYDITFKYTETFAPEIDYEQHHDYTASATELALLIEDGENKLSIQHLLVLMDTMVIKHWRQDWEYENTKVYHYTKDNSWEFKSLTEEEVKGQWTQKVYQVDDSPRYSGSATWIHADGKHYWENKSDSPLPRREYSKRSDYNVMFRGNRQEITDFGWIHEQDNDKIIREDDVEDVLLAQEKGYNTYTKVANDKCKVAAEWWKEHKDFWGKARSSWEKIYDREGGLTLKKKVDDQPMFMQFYELEKENASKNAIAKTIRKFIDDKKEVNAEGK